MCAPSATDTTGIVQALHGLMERLAAPDLTAAEAQVLRPRLLCLLEAIDQRPPGRTAPAADLRAARGPGACVVV
jgi:hypothetical protein